MAQNLESWPIELRSKSQSGPDFHKNIVLRSRVCRTALIRRTPEMTSKYPTVGQTLFSDTLEPISSLLKWSGCPESGIQSGLRQTRERETIVLLKSGPDRHFHLKPIGRDSRLRTI